MSTKIRAASAACLLTLFVAGMATPAAAADSDIDALRAEIARLTERLNQLEARSKAAPAPAPKPAMMEKTAKKKSSPIKIKGDIRYRYELIDQEGREDRKRNRIRARVGISGDVNDTVKAGVQFATGGDSPTSTNQTLDDGFSTKDLGVDLAYVTWKAAEHASVTAGKMKNPFHRAGGNALVWDGDLNPEGVAVNFRNGAFFANLGGLYVEERSSSDDSLLFGGQLGFDTDLDNGMNLTAGVSYFSYTNTIGNSPFYDGDSLGNTVDANGDLVHDYKELELFAELGTEIGDLPVALFADWVQNTEADNFDTGYAFGAKLGKASDPGTWDFAWIYQDIEADAVIATFNDSDFGGGGTDGKGHIFKGKYSIARNWTAGFTYFVNEINENAGSEIDYKRLQADLQFKF